MKSGYMTANSVFVDRHGRGPRVYKPMQVSRMRDTSAGTHVICVKFPVMSKALLSLLTLSSTGRSW